MSISNIERLQNVADGFDELNEKITYVGGAVTGLYPNGAAASSHQTMDVECSLPSGEEGRTELILEIFKAISALR